MEKRERKKLFWQTYLTGAVLAAAVLGAVAAFGGRGTAAFALGGGAGLAAALAAHACLFRAWGAAPDMQGVVCWYLLRLGIVFGAVVLALFVPFIDALGVLVPQLFCLPVLAVRLALEKKKPNHFAVRQYKKYKLAAGKTAKSILISCGARLAPFDIQEVRDVTAYDELQLDTLGDKKTALFLIMSDTDATFNFLISMIYTQLFNLLCEKADDVYGGRLPVHVRCLIDEMANIGQIPNLEKLVATIRSREISACLVLQAQSQLKAIYKDNADTIIGNMDSRIFLGGSEPTTLKELNQALGKETIDTYNTSNTRGNSPSYGQNFQKLGKDLASVDELAVLDGSKCILQLRGVRPFLSDKYDLTQHPNYKYTSDFDKRNEFNIEQFLSRRLKLKAGDEFVVVDAD